MRHIQKNLILVILLLILSACSSEKGEATSSANTAPVANAGADQNVHTTSSVLLDGSSSYDSDSNQITYLWKIITKPTNSNTTLTNPTTVNPTITTDIDGGYVLSLVVNDGSVDSKPDTIEVNAIAQHATLATPTLTTTPTLTDRGSVEVEVNGEVGTDIYVNGELKGTLDSSGKDKLMLDTSGADGVKSFSIIVKNGLGNESDPLEVNIIKSAIQGGTELVSFDIAHKLGIATQGTTGSYQYYEPASNVIDADENTYNHTAGDQVENWLQIELPNATKINKIVVKGRQSSEHRLEGAEVYISQTPYNGTLNSSEKVFTLLGNKLKQEINPSFAPVAGEYLIIKAAGDFHLHLISVEVYGEVAQTPYFKAHETAYIVPLNSAIGHEITQLQAADNQGTSLTYTAEGEMFGIDENGNVTVIGTLTSGLHAVRITVSDGTYSASTMLSITVTSENAVKEALQTGSIESVTEHELVEATLEEIERNRTMLSDAKQKIFNLNSDGTSNVNSLRSIDWDPTHDAITMFSTPGMNTPLLYTNAVTDNAKTVYKKEVAIIGEKEKGKYLLFGSNPFRQIVNGEMNSLLENSIAWLANRDDLKSNAFSVVISHLEDRSYFRDESGTRDWLDTHYAGSVTYNAENACDGDALQGCLDNKPDLLIISQKKEVEEDEKAIASVVNSALKSGTPVLYIHLDGQMQALGNELFSSVFDVTYEWDNYWKKLKVEAYDPLDDYEKLSPSVASIKTLYTHIQAGDFSFDWSQCTNDADCSSEVTGLEENLLSGADTIKTLFNALDLQKINIFDSEGYTFHKLLALSGDKIRQDVSYPASKNRVSSTTFARTFLADNSVYNYRNINPVPPNMGNFSRSDFSHITPKSMNVTRTSRMPFKSTGAYALPGQTVRITRTDNNSELEVKVFVNTVRAGATHIYRDNNYNRPKYLQTPKMILAPGESIEFTSCYGGPIELAFDKNNIEATVAFENVGEHPYWASAADDDTFTAALEANEYDWAELATIGFEVHSKLEKMVESISDWATLSGESESASNLAAATVHYTSNYPFSEAGLKGAGIDVIPEVKIWADNNSFEIKVIDIVKHMNADQAACGGGCSGNPYDAYWAYSPVGHGDIHEMGHSLEKSQFMLDGWEGHSQTNPYSYYTKTQFHKQTGKEPSCQNLPFDEMYSDLNASKHDANPKQYLQDNLWPGGWNHQVLFTIQTMMQIEKLTDDGKVVGDDAINDGWHLLTREHVLYRELKEALNDEDNWTANRSKFGFDSYTISEVKALDSGAGKNDWVLIVLSKVSHADLRDHFDMWGIDYSSKASDQVASFGYVKAPKGFFMSTSDGYCKTDGFGDYLDKTFIPYADIQ